MSGPITQSLVERAFDLACKAEVRGAFVDAVRWLELALEWEANLGGVTWIGA
jgi:hypothetical protein